MVHLHNGWCSFDSDRQALLVAGWRVGADGRVSVCIRDWPELGPLSSLWPVAPGLGVRWAWSTLKSEEAPSVIGAGHGEPSTNSPNHNVVISPTSCLGNRQILEREILQ